MEASNPVEPEVMSSPNQRQRKLANLQKMIEGRIIGQHALIRNMLICLLCDGHILIEGMPGLAKTTAAKAMAEGVEGDFHRIQFTPDLLPADLIGTEIYVREKSDFTFRRGPIFNNILLADEINRAPAKVQSALLEAMEEKQVTVGLEEETQILRHRDEQAGKLLVNLTSQHQPSLVAQVTEVADVLKSLSAPQFLQFVAMNEAVIAVCKTQMMYFAQTGPSELGNFRWRIDAKDKAQTDPEKIWNLLLPAFIEGRSFREPEIRLIGADYSHFSRFTVWLKPEEVARRQAVQGATVTQDELIDGKAGSDINKIIREDIAFQSSHESLGLQLADVATSIAARAMRGTIRLRGWWNLGKIMLSPLKPDEVIKFIRFQQANPRWEPSPPYVAVCKRLGKSCLPLVVIE